MKAAQISQFGEPSVIAIHEIEKPSISDDQLLIEVTASSINPFDGAMLGGAVESLANQFPVTLGLDIVGTIVEIGADVTGFSVGDRVYGSANVLGGASGAFAEFAAVNPARVAKAPDTLTDQEVASLPTAGISALQAVIDHGHVAAGQKVFINGGSGGVGVIAIQIAKAIGAYVATTASTDNVDFVKSLGADEVIDYKTDDFTAHLHDYDVALDNVRGDKDAVLKVIKDGGVAVSLTGPFSEELAKERNITTTTQFTDVSTVSLKQLAAMIADGKVKPVIAKTIPLDDVASAFAAKQSESVQGKIVVAIR